MKFCKCGCGQLALKNYLIGHNKKGVKPWNYGKGKDRTCIECQKQRTIKGRGRCSGCYKRMIRNNLPNDYTPLINNSGHFTSETITHNKGVKHDKKTKDYLSYINKGTFHPRFKHGKYIDYHRKARKILSEHLNTELKDNQVVHHIDGNVMNNKTNNLMLFQSHSEHMKYHWKIQKEKKLKGRLKSD